MDVLVIVSGQFSYFTPIGHPELSMQALTDCF